MSDCRIPLTIVTGFLGSGKTTLIRHLLTDARAARAAIIVNEFGAAGIDHHLFRKTDERITLLRDGCACCARRDDLVAALVDLIRQVDRGELPDLDRVILETSGLADPGPIQHTLVADPVLSRRFRINRMISTCDVLAGEQNLEMCGEAIRQVAAADLVAITKTDLADVQTADRLRGLLSHINPAATVVATEHGRLGPDLAFDDDLSPGQHGAVSFVAPPSMHTEPGGVASFCLDFTAPLDWRMLGLWLTMLLHRHGERILRVKGLLDVGAGGPLLLEGVQHVVHQPRHLESWPDGERRSRLVIIAREIDPNVIRESLATFDALARHHA